MNTLILCKMKKKRIISIGTIIILFFMMIFANYTYAQENEEKEWQEKLTLYATSAVLMDADNGRVLYSKNGYDFMANASTTKIMTCILALEHTMLDDEVMVSAYAASMPEVKMQIKVGETYYMKDLLYALMLESYNDVAVAIAEHIGSKALQLPKENERSVEESKLAVALFADIMNEKAMQIGCDNTYFITPNGLDATEVDDDGNEVYHGTTAHDIALIMAYCMNQSSEKEMFLTITQTAHYGLANRSGTRSFSCVNHNAFLSMMEGAKTGKTGFTNRAGYCYVGGFEKDGKSFTIALLACGWPSNKTYKWADARILYTYGMEKYAYYEFEDLAVDIQQFQDIIIKEGQSEGIDVSAISRLEVVRDIEADDGVLLHMAEEIVVGYELKEQLQAPVYVGDVVGNIEYKVGEEVFRKDDIILRDTILKIDFQWCFIQILKKYFL